MRVLLVHNARAGDGRFDRESLMGLIHDAGHSVEYAAAGDKDWRQSIRGDTDLIAAAGGDGTVAKVARSVAGRGIPIGVIPLGTANNIAAALDVSGRSIPQLIDGWAEARRQPFDIGLASLDKPIRFVESAGIGVLATSIARIAHGDAGYVDEIDEVEDRLDAAIDVLREELMRLEPVPVELRLDRLALSGAFVMVEVLNFGGAGANLRFAHDANPADGLFDVVVVDESGRQNLFEHLPLYRTDPARAPRLPAYRARHVTLACGPCDLHLDDRLRRRKDGRDVSVELTVEPRVLTFLV